MNLPRALFFWDRYHLLNDILPKQFEGGWEQVSPYVQQVIHAKSPEDHNVAVAEVHCTFRGKVNILNIEQFAKQKKQSVNYSFTIQSNGDQDFIRKGYEHSPRVVPFGKRCNCDVPVQFLQQCWHETIEENSAFLLSLHNLRHIFHCMTKTEVKRTVVISAQSSSDQTVESILDSIDDSVFQ